MSIAGYAQYKRNLEQMMKNRQRQEDALTRMLSTGGVQKSPWRPDQSMVFDGMENGQPIDPLLPTATFISFNI